MSVTCKVKTIKRKKLIILQILVICNPIIFFIYIYHFFSIVNSNDKGFLERPVVLQPLSRLWPFSFIAGQDRVGAVCGLQVCVVAAEHALDVVARLRIRD